MNFEEAARQHKRLERIEEVLAARDDLVSDIDRLYGIAVAPSLAADSVLLWLLCQGSWQEPLQFSLASHVSLDARLKELVASLRLVAAPLAERQEHLALLALFELERRRVDRVSWAGSSAVSQAGARDFAGAAEGGGRRCGRGGRLARSGRSKQISLSLISERTGAEASLECAPSDRNRAIPVAFAASSILHCTGSRAPQRPPSCA